MEQNKLAQFGLYVRQLREAQGLSFDEAAYIFHKCRHTSHHPSSDYLRMTETGEIMPNMFNLKLLAGMYKESYESMKKRALLFC